MELSKEQRKFYEETREMARKEIEDMSGRKVFLELRVKVNKNWRNNASALQLLGYTAKK